MLANTPKPPYYAVIFSSTRCEGEEGYNDMSEEMIAEVQNQPGFLGFESARNEMGITVSYWKDEKSIANWRENNKHKIARNKGKVNWYKEFKVRICRVERDYDWKR